MRAEGKAISRPFALFRSDPQAAGAAGLALRREQAKLMRGETRRVMSHAARLEEEAEALENSARKKREMVANLVTDLESRGKRLFLESPI